MVCNALIAASLAGSSGSCCLSHPAYIVRSSVIKASKSNFSVHSLSIYQPVNTKPSFTGSSGRSTVLFFSIVCGSTWLPPFVSNVTVTCCSVACASNAALNLAVAFPTSLTLIWAWYRTALAWTTAANSSLSVSFCVLNPSPLSFTIFSASSNNCPREVLSAVS